MIKDNIKKEYIINGNSDCGKMCYLWNGFSR